MIVNETGDLDNDLTGPKELLDKIIAHLRTYYIPVKRMEDADMHLTTTEIYNKIQALFPSIDYGPGNIAQCLDKLGYKWMDLGEMKFEWLMKKKELSL